MSLRYALFACLALALAGVSVALVDPAPSYDPWSWLLWGREVADGTLSTTDGPAFKPLPVAVTALLSPLGEAAPIAWVVFARAAALAAVGLAFVVAHRAAGTVAGVLAAAGVLLCGAFAGYSAAGDVTGLLLALVLAAALAWQRGRLDLAVALGIAAALVRVEVWPFLAIAGVLAWRRSPAARPAVVAAALVPLAWFVPEWLGSGDLLRSSERARIPDSGQPALAEVPFLASIGDAVALPLLPLLVAAILTLRSSVRWVALAGVAWVALVALMAEAGFSGEPRYALPGAALIAIGGGIALGRMRGAALAAGLVLVAVAATPRVADLTTIRSAQAYQWQLATDLSRAIDAAGGRDAVLRCGTVYVGPRRGPLLAYRLEVRKQDVEPDVSPRAPGTAFRSRRIRGAPPLPDAAEFDPLGRVGLWTVSARCR